MCLLTKIAVVPAVCAPVRVYTRLVSRTQGLHLMYGFWFMRIRYRLRAPLLLDWPCIRLRFLHGPQIHHNAGVMSQFTTLHWAVLPNRYIPVTTVKRFRNIYSLLSVAGNFPKLDS